MGISSLGYLGFNVSNIDEWVHFATEGVLGMEALPGPSGDTTYLRMDEYHHRLVLHSGGEDDVAFIGWEVSTPQELEEMRQRLHQAGVETIDATREELADRKVVSMFKFRDLNDLPVEIFHGPLVLWEQPFKPSRNIGGFKTGGQGLGHCVYPVKDLKTTTDFYANVMGFKLTDYIDLESSYPGMGTMVFFHCNPRHHSIAFAEFKFPKKIQHFMVEVNSMDDVGRTYELCQENGVEFFMSLGRHTNDHMFSFYMKSPSGFAIEYGWGGRTVDDSTWVVQQHVAPATWGHKMVPA